MTVEVQNFRSKNSCHKKGILEMNPLTAVPWKAAPYPIGLHGELGKRRKSKTGEAIRNERHRCVYTAERKFTSRRKFTATTFEKAVR
jgi:hypothetical protein